MIAEPIVTIGMLSLEARVEHAGSQAFTAATHRRMAARPASKNRGPTVKKLPIHWASDSVVVSRSQRRQCFGITGDLVGFCLGSCEHWPSTGVITTVSMAELRTKCVRPILCSIIRRSGDVLRSLFTFGLSGASTTETNRGNPTALDRPPQSGPSLKRCNILEP